MIDYPRQFDHVSERKDQSKMPILIVLEFQYVYLFGTGKVKVELKKKRNFGSFLGILDRLTTYASKNILFIF